MERSRFYCSAKDSLISLKRTLSARSRRKANLQLSYFGYRICWVTIKLSVSGIIRFLKWCVQSWPALILSSHAKQCSMGKWRHKTLCWDIRKITVSQHERTNYSPEPSLSLSLLFSRAHRIGQNKSWPFSVKTQTIPVETSYKWSYTF